MHIGFDISQTGKGKAGCGYFAHALVTALLEVGASHSFALYPSFGDFYLDVHLPSRSPYGGNSSYGPRFRTIESARRFWEAPDLETALKKPDVVHSNNFWAPVQLRSSRLVYTFYDFGFAMNPEWTTEANRIGCFSGTFRAAAFADWIVAISKASRDHFLAIHPHFPESRISVVSPCSRFPDATAQGLRPKVLQDVAPGEYWLSVGTIEPRKNQRLLAEAYARYLELNGRPLPLVFAGGKGWLMDDFHLHLERLGVADRVILTGYVSDDELVWLYRNCYANLYPSVFEGFGLPVLEGMQFGAATLASTSSSIPEVAGDAAISLSPDSPGSREEWARAMLALSTDPVMREALRAKSVQQAATFSWRESAAQTLAIYEQVVALPKRAQQ